MLHVGQWNIPTISGQRPSPTDNFALNKLPHNRGIMFGGAGGIGVPSNDIYMLEIAEDSATVVSYM